MQLHPFQERIIQQCVEKGKGGLSLPMGSGKTIISLKLALEKNEKNKKILIVASKTLVSSWSNEIEKWYPDLKYKCLTLTETMSEEDKIIITTPSTLVKYYKKYDIKDLILEKRRDSPFGPETTYYREVKSPMLKLSYSTFYSVSFGYLIVDEAHNFLNIETLTCRSLISINADNKWLLSGTLFSEPKDKNIMGFIRMCDLYGMFPDNLPGLARIIKNKKFAGLKDYVVIAENNEMFIDRPVINKTIVKHEMSAFERKVYQVYRDMIKKIYKRISYLKLSSVNRDQVKNLNARLLGLILKLRICLVSPIITISKMYLDNIDNGDSKDIFQVVKDVFEENNIMQELCREENLVSTRIKMIIEKINEHKNERILVFSSFKMTLRYLEMIIKKYGIDRKIFYIDAEMSIAKRDSTIKEYSKTEGAVLLMTYTIGCEGLNLQSASVVMIMDVWWNEAKSRQAIARVYRFGQDKDISVYIFVSNSYIEYVMFEKHKDKSCIAGEILEGDVNTKITVMSLKKIVDILSEDDFDDNLIVKCL
jgi:SNF2 family DNA or RNA helicase